MFPLARMLKYEAFDEDATLKRSPCPPAAWRERSAEGVEVAPIATLPFWAIERRLAPVEEEMESGVLPAIPIIEKVAIGEDEPIPNLVLATSQKKFALSCDTSPFAPMNGTEPVVSPERYRLPVVVMLEVEALVILANVEKSVFTVPAVVLELLKYATPEDVKFVVDAFARLVCPVTVSREAVVVASVLVPVTAKRPVVVAFVFVRLVINAFVVVEFVTVKLVMTAVKALKNVAKRLELVALVLVRLVMLPVVEKSVFTVPTVVDEVLRTV